MESKGKKTFVFPYITDNTLLRIFHLTLLVTGRVGAGVPELTAVLTPSAWSWRQTPQAGGLVTDRPSSTRENGSLRDYRWVTKNTTQDPQKEEKRRARRPPALPRGPRGGSSLTLLR